MKKYILLLLASVLTLGTNAQVTSSDPIAPIDPVAAKVLTVSKSTTSVLDKTGLYDRVEMTRTANVGEMTLVVVPCVVDGYFFGADAKRYEVTRLRQVPAGTVYNYYYFQFETREMEDTEDFQPCHYYLVRPTVQTNKIVACEAGLKTEVGSIQKVLLNGPAFMAIPSEDVDRDGDVDNADVEGAIRFILQKNTEGLVLDAADVDDDGSVKSSDIVRLVNIILSGSWSKNIPNNK